MRTILNIKRVQIRDCSAKYFFFSDVKLTSNGITKLIFRPSRGMGSCLFSSGSSSGIHFSPFSGGHRYLTGRVILLPARQLSAASLCSNYGRDIARVKRGLRFRSLDCAALCQSGIVFLAGAPNQTRTTRSLEATLSSAGNNVAASQSVFTGHPRPRFFCRGNGASSLQTGSFLGWTVGVIMELFVNIHWLCFRWTSA